MIRPLRQRDDQAMDDTRSGPALLPEPGPAKRSLGETSARGERPPPRGRLERGNGEGKEAHVVFVLGLLVVGLELPAAALGHGGSNEIASAALEGPRALRLTSLSQSLSHCHSVSVSGFVTWESISGRKYVALHPPLAPCASHASTRALRPSPAGSFIESQPTTYTPECHRTKSSLPAA